MLIARKKDWNDYVACAEMIARGEAFAELRDSILERAAIQTGERVADLGAGTGLLTLPAAASAERVWAIDISRNMCEYLAAKALSADLDNVETVVSNVTSVPLVDGCVDVAMSNYCLHHLDDRQKRLALAEVHRVLVPGGRFVFADMMFSLAFADARNRAVINTKVRALLAKGVPGAWRLARNGARWMFGRWERPARPEWWAEALVEAGFTGVSVEPLRHEGGIAWAHKRPSSGDESCSRRRSAPALAGAGH